MKPIIQVENLSKKYCRKSNAHQRYGVLDLFSEIFGYSKDTRLREDEFLAVNDLSFTLYPGESFALIGRNGCGKTTTLRMLNGTLKPDAGTIRINGQVQALIALGSGFNLKLSGTENIYNAAAVLGLSRKNTKTIIEGIIDFAELENLIESPIETYSSGMKARLGFSVAIHLNPEILLIDEILGVGDYAFQNKCFRKMQQLKKNGVTIILVSHSHTRVIQMCEKALWMNNGKTMDIGSAKEIVNKYLSYLDKQEERKIISSKNKKNKNTALIKDNRHESINKPSESIYGPIFEGFEKIDNLKVSFLVNGSEDVFPKVHDKVVIEYSFNLKVYVKALNVTLAIYKKDGQFLTAISTLRKDVVKHINSGRVCCRVTIDDFCLNPEQYVLVMPIHEGQSYLYRNIVKEFIVKANRAMTWGLIDLEYKYELLQ